MSISLKDKNNLTIKEAAQYFNIGENKIRELTKEPGCEYVLYVGKRTLIKRKVFENYLEKITYL